MRNSKGTRFATTASYLQRVNLAIDHMVIHFQERFQEPLRLRDLARVAMLSPFHFHRVFHAIVGLTPADFLKKLRIDKALGLMARTPAPPLTSIALASGFSSSSDFSRSFKLRFNVPPSAFDLQAWRNAQGDELTSTVEKARVSVDHKGQSQWIDRLPSRHNPDKFKVKIREIPARTVAYIRVSRPYQGDGVLRAARRLVEWADRQGFAEGQWLGYQWDNPEITPLEDCKYHVAVEGEGFTPKGEIGRFRFPRMIVAEVEIQGALDLELRALHWIYGNWLPRSGFVPDDHPAFEAWVGRPFEHGTGHFEIRLQLPIRRP